VITIFEFLDGVCFPRHPGPDPAQAALNSVFANGQSVQSTVVPRRPSPVGGLGKARLQSYRPWEQQFGLTIVRLQSAYKYRGCYLKILNTTVAGCGRQMGISLNRKV